MIRRLIILLLIVGCDPPICCMIGCPSGAEVNCWECSCECRNGAEIDDCFSCDGNNYFDADGLLPNGDCNCDGAVKDCSGDCGGDLVEDDCGVCDGDGSSCEY